MEFGILGPLELRRESLSVAAPVGKPAVLLAVLLLRRNEPVSTARLIDEVWGEAAPRTALKTLQVHVSQLRKTVGSDVLETRGSAYVLRVGPGELDAERFESLLAEGRRALEQGDAAGARALIVAALGLWRGPPLAEFAYEPFAAQEVERLEELRLQAVEERIEADLALGAAAELVAELEPLVVAHPFRERLRGQLMLAFYRCGRQYEALETYRTGRQTMVEELGLEPGEQLRELERRILRQDPSLLPRPVAAEPRRLARRGRRRHVRAAVTIGALAVVAAVVLAAVLGTSGPGPAVAARADSAVAVDPGSGRLTRVVALGAGPTAVASGGGEVWTANATNGTVTSVDPATGAVETIPVGHRPAGIAYGAGRLWVTDGDDNTVDEVDPSARKVVRTIPVGNGPSGVAVGSGAVWIANTVDGTVARVDPRRGVVVATVAVGEQPGPVAASDGAVWVGLAGSGSIARIDPKGGNVVDRINVGNGPAAVAVGGGRVWVANAQDGTVTAVDPASDAVAATVPVGGAPVGIVFDRGVAWVAVDGDALAGIEGATPTVRRWVRLGSPPSGLAAAGGSVWTALGASPAAHRGGVLRVVTSDLGGCGCVDPAADVDVGAWRTLELAYDGLVAFRHTSGAAGSQLVGDLATDVPAPSNGGTTYVFRLRPGIRFSNGAPVRPTDVKASFERMLQLGRANPDPPSPAIYGNVVAADACLRVPRRCDLSRGILADDADRTVTFRLRAPDPDFLYKLALPFAFVLPAQTPRSLLRVAAPGTGPYRIEFLSGSRARLVRSRRFTVFAPAARPDGYPDEIDFHLTSPAVVAATGQGTADVALAVTLATPSAGAAPQNAAGVHADPTGATELMFLNTRTPPFDDVRVRRALNYAVDRARLVRLLGGELAAQPTCQILPPGFPGHRSYCPYTLDPSPAETWSAPDVAKAERLVAASGTRGATVRVWASPHHRAIADYFASLLRQLGYRAQAKIVAPGHYYDAVGDSRLHPQIGWELWLRDYTSAADFLQTMFGCASFVPANPGATLNLSELCDTAVERTLASAQAMQQRDPTAAWPLWAAADRLVVDRAAAVPYANPHEITLTSPRVGNYQFNPEWGPLLDQLWVR